MTSVCKCGALIEVPSWLTDNVGYMIQCHADCSDECHGGGHTIEFSLEGYQDAEIARLERMLE